MEEKIYGRFWLYPLAILLHTAMDGFDSTDAALMMCTVRMRPAGKESVKESSENE